MKNNELQEIRDVIKKCTTIAIGGHTNPDGDAIGACMALAHTLSLQKKTVSVLLEPYGAKYDFIQGKEYLVPLEQYADVKPQLFLSLDCGDKARLGTAGAVFDRAECTINIDHHVSNEYFADMNYVKDTASSTSELVYHLLKDVMPIDMETASALYAGIIYDSGGFRHSSTSPETMFCAGELMKYGIPFTAIYNQFFDRRTFSEIKIVGKALEKAQTMFDGQFIYTAISNDEIQQCRGTNKELDSIVNYIKGVEGVKISCFLYEKSENVVKASFRAEDGYDVCKLSQIFGGGGHVKAAGCSMEGTLDSALQAILSHVKKLF